MSINQVQNHKTRLKIKIPPWISAVLILISSVALVFLLLTSMESAFGFVEGFFEQMPNAVWFFQVPIPIICAIIVYYIANHNQKRSLYTLVFLSSASFTGVIGMIIYYIIYDYSSFLNQSNAYFNYILILLAVSLVIGAISIFITKYLVKERTLH